MSPVKVPCSVGFTGHVNVPVVGRAVPLVFAALVLPDIVDGVEESGY